MKENPSQFPPPPRKEQKINKLPKTDKKARILTIRPLRPLLIHSELPVRSEEVGVLGVRGRVVGDVVVALEEGFDGGIVDGVGEGGEAGGFGGCGHCVLFNCCLCGVGWDGSGLRCVGKGLID